MFGLVPNALYAPVTLNFLKNDNIFFNYHHKHDKNNFMNIAVVTLKLFWPIFGQRNTSVV